MISLEYKARSRGGNRHTAGLSAASHSKQSKTLLELPLHEESHVRRLHESQILQRGVPGGEEDRERHHDWCDQIKQRRDERNKEKQNEKLNA